MVEVTQHSAAPDEAGRLLDDELLVWDGVAKLYLCWFAWTLAQWQQCERFHVHPDLKESPLKDSARFLWDRISTSTAGRGFGGGGGAASDSGGIRALIRDDYFAEMVKGVEAPVLPAIASRQMALPKAPDRFEWLKALFGRHVVAETWSLVNAAESGFVRMALHEGKHSPRNLSRTGEDPTVRFLGGSVSSIERMSAAAYAGGASLAEYQEGDLDGALCSPLPLKWLVRWGKIIAFGPLVADDASEAEVEREAAHLSERQAAVWQAFCGARDGDLRGGTCADFAARLQVLADSEEQVDQRRQDNKVVIPAKNRSRNPDAGIGGSTTWLGSDAAAPQPRLIAREPDEDDHIVMRIDSSQGAISIAGLQYRFDQDASEADERVCLKALEVKWNWRRSDAVAIDSRWAADDSHYKAAAAADNPSVEIRAATHDTASFAIRFADKAALPFAPSPDVAVARLQMPPAAIAALPAHTHEFSVRARKQDLCIARQDRRDGRYREIDRRNTPSSMDEQVRRSVEIAYVEISNGFPADGSAHALGVRQAEPISPEAQASCPPTGLGEGVR